MVRCWSDDQGWRLSAELFRIPTPALDRFGLLLLTVGIRRMGGMVILLNTMPDAMLSFPYDARFFERQGSNFSKPFR